ncbi:MAG: polymorphic toxin type 50 domain-containing protein, partial [Pyrinomonadaceae bacterium]
KKISNTETTIFVYNASGQLVAEYSTALAQTQQVSYLTNDHLGSPRVTTNEDGLVTGRKDYSAFGEESFTAQRTSSLGYTGGGELRKGYTGYEKDSESGLDFAQARYYSSTHGRYTSVDPLTASASIRNPQTFNRYSYVLNSPYKFTDPLGLIPVTTGACGGSCPNSGPTVDGSSIRGRDASFASWGSGCPVFAECYIAEDGSTRYIDPASGEEFVYIGTADSGVIDEGGSIKHENGPNTLTNDQAIQQHTERRASFIWNNIFALAGHGIGKLFRGLTGLFKSSNITTPTKILPISGAPKIDMGKQGKHIIGSNNFIPGRSVLTANPQQLAGRAGTGQQVGNVPVGQAGAKERIDFGSVIGNFVNQNGQSIPTSKGIIIYSKSGIHIVPAQP